MAQNIIQGPGSSRKPQINYGGVLGGREFRFTLIWLPRMKWWSLSMFTRANQTMFRGLRVVADLDMLQPYNMPERPPGQIICHDTTGAEQPPGRWDFLERHLFLYVDPVVASPGPSVVITRFVEPVIPEDPEVA